MKTTYFIDGMHCQQCVSKVKAALEQLPGVTTLVVTIGKAEIESTHELSRESIESALLEAGDYRLATKAWAIKTYIPLIIAFTVFENVLMIGMAALCALQ